LLEQKHQLDLEKEKARGPELPYKQGTVKKFPFGEKEFEFGIYTGTPQKYPNVPPGWEPTGIKGKRTSAINLDLGQQIERHQKKTDISQASELQKDAIKRDRQLKQGIMSHQFPGHVENRVAKRFGGISATSDWMDMEQYEKEEHIFNEMDKLVKEAFPMATFDPGRDAWIDVKTRRIIRKYMGRTPMFHKRRDKRH
jgi:hypothetical protein